MKKILTILFTVLSCAVMAQKPVQTLGNKGNIVKVLGELGADSAILFPKDTIQLLSTDRAIAFKGTNVYQWDGAKWGLISGASGVSGSILNDSTFLLCNSNGCDTFTVQNITITSFTFTSDSTVSVCNSSGACDTISFPPVPLNKFYVDSTKILSGSVDTLVYYINGVRYIGGFINHFVSPSDGLISGGTVSWSGTGLTFDITSAVFRKFGVLYNTNDTTITLNAPDLTYSRIDLFALDTSNGGEVIKITGTPSPTPVAPQTQDFQIALTTGITLNVGDTVPSNVSIQKIYDENIEWATSTNGGITVNFNDLSNPFTGVKDALVSDYNNIGRVVFTRTGNGVIDGSEVLKFHISLRKSFSSILSIGFFDGSNPSSNLIRVTSNNGLDPNKINQYQTIAIPISAFTFTNNSYSRLIIYASGYDTTGTGGFYLDDVELQSGINNIPSPTDYSNKADSTTTKRLNDSTYVGLYWVKGIPYQKGDTIKIHSTTIDSINVSILNGGKIDTSHLPVSKIYIQQAGAGETHIVRAADDTTLSVATLKNSADVTPSKNADSSISFNFTVPHYTKDQVDSIAAGITSGSCDTCVVKFVLSSDSTKLYPILQNGDSLPYIKWIGGGNNIDTTNKWVQSAGLNAAGDSLVVVKNGVRTATKITVGGTGTVSSVAMTMPGVLFNSSVTGSPITTSGTLAPSLASQSPYTNFGNNTASSATPTFFTNNFSDSLKRSNDSVFRRVNGIWYYQYKDSTGGGGGGGVTSITATSPLTGGTITTSGNIGISKADTSTNGYIDSASYRRFYYETDTSYRTIFANNLGLNPTYSLTNPKGLFLINNTYSTTNTGSQSSPSVFFKNWGYQNGTNYPQWLAINTSTDRSAGTNGSFFNFWYSTDSINWNSIGKISVTTGLNFPLANLVQINGINTLISASAVNGFRYSSSAGWYFGSNSVNNPGPSLATWADTTKAIVPPRGSSYARQKFTNGAVTLKVLNGGTGYVSGSPQYNALGSSNGSGLSGTVTVSGGVITAATVSGSGGNFWKYGDSVGIANLSGSGAILVVTRLMGDTIRGGLFSDTTNNKLYQWSGGNSGSHSWSYFLDSTNTYVGGGNYASLTANKTVASYTLGSVNSIYDIGGTIDVSAVSGGTVLLQATWTDINSQSHTKSFYNQGSTTDALSTLNDASSFPPMRIWAKAGTTITISTVVTGTITYDVTGTIQFIR